MSVFGNFLLRECPDIVPNKVGDDRELGRQSVGQTIDKTNAQDRDREKGKFKELGTYDINNKAKAANKTKF